MHKRTFLVRGTDRPSGKEKELKIEAVSHAEAREEADELGLEVSHVEYGDLSGVDSGERPTADPPDSSDLEREKAHRSQRLSVSDALESKLLREPVWTIAMGVVLGLFLWTVLVIIVYVVIILATGAAFFLADP